MTGAALLGKLRAVCRGFSEVEETVKWGNPSFAVAGKLFAVLDRYGGRPCIAFRATKQRRAILLRDGRCFAAPYDRQRAWVCRHADLRINWRDMATLLRASHALAFAAAAPGGGTIRRRKRPAGRRRATAR